MARRGAGIDKSNPQRKRSVMISRREPQPNGYRIKQARQIRGLSAGELAEWCGITERDLMRVEAKLAACERTTIERIAMKLGWPLAFFYQQDPPEFGEGSLAWHNGHGAQEGGDGV